MALPETSLFDEGPPPPCPDMFNMSAYVLSQASVSPEKIALRVLHDAAGTETENWSYEALDRAIRAVAAGLRSAGLKPGDRVALRLGNVTAFPIIFFSVIAAGGIAAPTSSQLTEREFQALLSDMDARFAVIFSDLEVALSPHVRRIDEPEYIEFLRAAPGEFYASRCDDPAFLIYTSGASGKPKGVLHAQRSAWARRMMWDGWYGLSQDDVMLHAGAFNWTYTLGTGLTDPLAAGARTVIYTGPGDAALWPRLIEREQATIFAAVPGVCRQLLRAVPGPIALPSLRHGLTAGEQLRVALAQEWQSRTGTELCEALGMSEVSTYISSPPGGPRRSGCCGRPQHGRRVAILDDASTTPVPCGQSGRLAVSRRDPGLMLGYWNQPDATDATFQGEWFVTGDRAVMHDDGQIAYIGRDDEVMTALGYRISPLEVEEAIAAHQDVADIAVAQLPVRTDLELIAAFVVPKAGWPGEDNLAAFAAQQLAAYKCPRIWIEVDALPRTANGKLLRRALVVAHRRD